MKLKADGVDILKLAGSFTLTSNTDTLGDQLDFEIAHSTLSYFPKVSVAVGSLIQLFDDDGSEQFRGIVVTSTTNETTQSFSCFDYAFYLNKSKVIKQFTKIRADTAIKQLLGEFGVPVGPISNMPTIISAIYYEKEVSDVIQDILDKVTAATSQKYVKEMNAGKFDIYKDTDLVISCTVRIASNIAPVDIGKTISSPSKTQSIEEMRNSIKIYIGSDTGVKVYAEVKNAALIKKYGLLQETQSIEEANIAQANNIAKNTLADLGKIITTGSITVLSNFKLRAGRILILNEPTTGLIGSYKIKSANHSIGTI